MQEWLTAIDEQVNFILEQPPTLALSSDLAHLILLREKLPQIAEIAPTDDSDHLESLIITLQCDLSDYKELKRKSIIENVQADTTQFRGILSDIESLLIMLRQGSDQTERQIMLEWLQKLNDKIK